MPLRPSEGSEPSSQNSAQSAAAARRASRDALDNAFDEFDIADLLESHAELVLNLTETVQQLESALESRTTIGEALGICMERYGIRDDQAFQFLVRISQEQNLKLREVAAHLLEMTARRKAESQGP